MCGADPGFHPFVVPAGRFGRAVPVVSVLRVGEGDPPDEQDAQREVEPSTEPDSTYSVQEIPTRPLSERLACRLALADLVACQPVSSSSTQACVRGMRARMSSGSRS